MFLEIIELLIYSGLIVVISKYVLSTVLRKFAESLNLKPKIVGEIAGIATSVPEFLTITISSLYNLSATSMVNILSSNIINTIQYVISIYLNKNKKAFENKAIKINIILVMMTIIIPILLLVVKIEIELNLVPIFIIIYFLFKFINKNVHKLYLDEEDKELEKKIEKETKWEKGNNKKIIKYIFCLLCSGVILFLITNQLGNNLNNLCNKFNISQIIIGCLLGFITSIPELVTFFEAQKYHKKQKEILGVVEATNNLLISNSLNLFIIQSLGIIIIKLF